MPSLALLPLTGRVLDQTHLDDNAAAEFVSGSMPPSALTRVEGHLAGCRDCRALVAALAVDAGDDSGAETVPHEKLSPSQVTQLPTRTLTIGDRVGRYLVLSALGAGGMGVVFSAYDPKLDRKVAIKLLRAGLTYNTKDARTRLRREAQAIAQLSHPNVVAVYDVGETDGGDLYIAMEFVEGDTLTAWLKKYPRSWREIVDVFLQAARGVIAAHSVGLLHRDLKPDNVLVGGDGRVRVTDFGLARSVLVPDEHKPRSSMTALDVDLTATGTVLGTPRYMAPEQLTGPDIDARADQFSFCVALYEALYGTHPLVGATSVAMLEQGEKALPAPEGTKVPAAIGRAVARGLDRDRAKRFPTMAALVSELVPPPPRAPVRFVALGVTAVVAGLVLAAVALRRDPPADVAILDESGRPISAVEPLIDKINTLERERRTLIADLDKLKSSSQRDLERFEAALQRKDRQIAELVKQVTVELGAAKRRPAPARAAPAASRGLQVVSIAHDTQGDVESCLVEWAARARGDVELIVRLTVEPDGRAHSPRTALGPDHDERSPANSPAMRDCVAFAIARPTYPAGPEQLELEVNVRWSEGMVSLASRITARRAPGSDVDLP